MEMKQILLQIASSFLALLVLASTITWTVDKHICMGRTINVSLFVHADDCGMAMVKDGMQEIEKSCCTDESFTVKGQDDLKISFHDLDLGQQLFVASFVYSYANLFEVLDENIVSFKDYSPPPLIRDVQILDQTFLI